MAGELKKKTLQRDQIKGGKKKSSGGSSGAAADGSPGKAGGPGGGADPNLLNSEAGGWNEGKKRRTKKVLLIGAPVLLLLLGAAGLFVFWPTVSQYFEDHTEKVKPITNIKRPIPIPDFRDTIDFLVYNEVENQKTLTMFRMELCFHSPSAFQNFKEQNVLFRETVYGFLLKQNTSRNTLKMWQAVVEKDLLNFIKVKLPQSQADIIRLTQVENL